jgi:L,D-peptidoglycan transpeptidase YkuD (ErfK/YbiS/YcfS/YnhG family)
VPVLLGRKGLAWGRGVFNPPQNGIPAKVEKDWRAPAGVFQLGSLFGYAATPPGGARWPYIQVGPWDAYVDDSNSPYYNRHVRIDPRQGVPPWFEKQKMRSATRPTSGCWKFDIISSPQPPATAAPFSFTSVADRTTPSAGCTTMAESDLVRLLRWVDPTASPHYVLLPKGDYSALRASWGLP